MKENNKATTRLEKKMAAQPSRYGGRGVECYNCGKAGHIATQCTVARVVVSQQATCTEMARILSLMADIPTHPASKELRALHEKLCDSAHFLAEREATRVQEKLEQQIQAVEELKRKKEEQTKKNLELEALRPKRVRAEMEADSEATMHGAP